MKTILTNMLYRFKLLPKPIRIISYSIITYAGYAVFLGLLVPAVLQSQAPKKLSELLGRDVRIADVKINPFLLRVQVNGFEIAESQGTTEFVSFKQLELEVDFWRTLLHLTPSIDHFDIRQPKVNIARLQMQDSEAVFNFSDILNQLNTQNNEQAQSPSEIETKGSSEIFVFRARSIRIEQGELSFQDKVTGARLDYHDLDFDLNQFDSQALSLALPEVQSKEKKQILDPKANIYTFALSGADQGQLQLDGQFQLQPLEVTGDFALSKLTLLPLWPLTEKRIKANLTSGEISFESSYHLKQQNEKLNISTDNGHFSLSNLTFKDNKTEKVKLHSLELNDIELSTASQTVSLDAIEMAGLWADASLSDKGLDLESLFTPTVSNTTPVTRLETEEKATDHVDDKPWLVRINNVEMADTDLNLRESLVSQGVNWRVYPLTLSTGNVISDLSQSLDYKVALGLSSDTNGHPTENRGQFSSSGQLDAKKLSVDGKLQVTSLDLSQFQPYLKPYLNMKLSKGNFSTGGNFSANSQGKADYQGQASIDNLLIKDGLKYEPLLKWHQLAVDSFNFDLSKRSLKINKILLNSPYAKMLIAKDRRTNIGELLVTNGQVAEPIEPSKQQNEESKQKTTEEKKTEKTAKAPDFALDVGVIEIVKGSAFFADNSLTPNFASGIESLQGQIKNLSSTPGTKAQIDIKGKIDKYAPVTLSGEINPLLEPAFLDLNFGLDSAELTSVNPYSGTYVGYYIDKGQLSLDINYRMENNQLKGSNHVVIDQLTLGKLSESELATSLPVSLAIALLQDTDGVIDLGVDVSGDIDSPDFSFGSIIATAIGNVITKAVTAPFSLLANLVGSDDEFNIVQYKPGLATLDSDEVDKLEKLAKALVSRPKLKISVEGSVIPTEDSNALAEAKLKQKLLHGSGLVELPQDLSASRIPESGPLATALATLFVQELKLNVDQERTKVEQKLLEKEKVTEVDPVYVTSVLHIGMYNQLIKAQEISHHDLGNLAELRARAVKAFLVEKNSIKPERIFILDSKTQLLTEQSQAILTLQAD